MVQIALQAFCKFPRAAEAQHVWHLLGKGISVYQGGVPCVNSQVRATWKGKLGSLKGKRPKRSRRGFSLLEGHRFPSSLSLRSMVMKRGGSWQDGMGEPHNCSSSPTMEQERATGLQKLWVNRSHQEERSTEKLAGRRSRWWMQSQVAESRYWQSNEEAKETWCQGWSEPWAGYQVLSNAAVPKSGHCRGVCSSTGLPAGISPHIIITIMVIMMMMIAIIIIISWSINDLPRTTALFYSYLISSSKQLYIEYLLLSLFYRSGNSHTKSFSWLAQDQPSCRE